jgi:hypothetical protein
MPNTSQAEPPKNERLDLSWLASSKILRWKSWFYEGLVPQLSKRGPLEAGAELERVSYWINKCWPMRWREIRKAVRRNRVACDAPWAEQVVTGGLATQMLRYLARDCILDSIPPYDWPELCQVMSTSKTRLGKVRASSFWEAIWEGIWLEFTG